MTLHDHFGTTNDGDKIPCINPDHADKNPSMAVFADHVYCFSCGHHLFANKIDANIKVEYVEPTPLEIVEDYTELFRSLSDLTDEASGILTRKGIEKTATQALRWRYSYGNDIPPGIVIPYFFKKDEKQVVAYYRIRRIGDTKNRFLSPKGGRALPYVIPTDSDYIYVTEGESDAATLASRGLHAIGIPGANQKNCMKYALENHHEKEWILVFDSDAAGRIARNNIEALCREVHGYTPKSLTLKKHKDFNDYHVAQQSEKWYEPSEVFDLDTAPVPNLNKLKEILC